MQEWFLKFYISSLLWSIQIYPKLNIFKFEFIALLNSTYFCLLSSYCLFWIFSLPSETLTILPGQIKYLLM
jgi:hypothetical protein